MARLSAICDPLSSDLMREKHKLVQEADEVRIILFYAVVLMRLLNSVDRRMYSEFIPMMSVLFSC